MTAYVSPKKWLRAQLGHSSPEKHADGDANAVEIFRPSLENEAMRQRRQAAVESVQTDWLRRSHQHHKKMDNRRVARAVEDHKTTSRLCDEALRHAGTMSLFDRKCMHGKCAFESELEQNVKHFNDDVSLRDRQAHDHREEVRDRAYALQLANGKKQNEILVQASQKSREILSARTAAIDDIRKHCRENRVMPPGSPHHAREPFRPLVPDLPQTRPTSTSSRRRR